MAPLLVVAILTPLWASYLVKVYAWRLILSEGGLADWMLKPFALSGPGFGLTAAVLTLTYLWLPYMILPIHTALEQLPANLLDASADLGARAAGPSGRWCSRWCCRRWRPGRSSRSH